MASFRPFTGVYPVKFGMVHARSGHEVFLPCDQKLRFLLSAIARRREGAACSGSLERLFEYDEKGSPAHVPSQHRSRHKPCTSLPIITKTHDLFTSPLENDFYIFIVLLYPPRIVRVGGRRARRRPRPQNLTPYSKCIPHHRRSATTRAAVSADQIFSRIWLILSHSMYLTPSLATKNERSE